jgi:hypothetical protein
MFDRITQAIVRKLKAMGNRVVLGYMIFGFVRPPRSNVA